jgi:hypothetical protein
MDDRELHAHLIDQQGSRAALNTPVLVLDLDRLTRNIAAILRSSRSSSSTSTGVLSAAREPCWPIR